MISTSLTRREGLFPSITVKRDTGKNIFNGLLQKRLSVPSWMNFKKKIFTDDILDCVIVEDWSTILQIEMDRPMKNLRTLLFPVYRHDFSNS